MRIVADPVASSLTPYGRHKPAAMQRVPEATLQPNNPTQKPTNQQMSRQVKYAATPPGQGIARKIAQPIVQPRSQPSQNRVRQKPSMPMHTQHVKQYGKFQTQSNPQHK